MLAKSYKIYIYIFLAGVHRPSLHPVISTGLQAPFHHTVTFALASCSVFEKIHYRYSIDLITQCVQQHTRVHLAESSGQVFINHIKYNHHQYHHTVFLTRLDCTTTKLFPAIAPCLLDMNVTVSYNYLLLYIGPNGWL